MKYHWPNSRSGLTNDFKLTFEGCNLRPRNIFDVILMIFILRVLIKIITVWTFIGILFIVMTCAKR